MVKSLKFRAVALAVGALASMFAVSSANAYTYAVSALEIKDLVIGISGPGVTSTPGSYSFTSSADASFQTNGNTQGGSIACSSAFPANCANPFPANPTLDMPVANATGSAPLRINNSFTFLGTAPGTSYANADAVIWSSELLNPGNPDNTRTQQISEGLLNSNNLATSNSKVGSSTGLVFSFVVGGGPATMSIRFKADADMRVDNTNPSFNSATSDMNASFTLNRTGVAGTNRFTWTPKGTVANDCAKQGFAAQTCTENSDGENLNQQLATDQTPDTQSNSSFSALAEYTSFGLTITGLVAGTYTVVLNAGTGTVLERFAVPEPGSLALLGLALAGLGVATKRRKS